MADRRAAVRPRRRVRPAGGEPGSAQRPARQHPDSQVDRRGAGVQGHGHHALPRHRHQRVEHHRRRAHLRHRRQQPGRALPRAQRHRRVPQPGHVRELQHLQHAQADPGTDRALPGSRRPGRLLRAGTAQPDDRPAEPGRQPRPRHLLQLPQPGRPTRSRPGVGRRHVEHRLQLVLVLPGQRAGNPDEAGGLDLLLQRHDVDREPVPAFGAHLDPARHHRHADDVVPGQ